MGAKCDNDFQGESVTVEMYNIINHDNTNSNIISGNTRAILGLYLVEVLLTVKV